MAEGRRMIPARLGAVSLALACLCPRAAAGEAFSLRVASYRTASSPLGAKEDVSGAAARLAALRPDAVALQGLWTAGDRAKFLAALRNAGLPHHRYFKSGLFGSGLLLVSRYEITRAYFTPFRVRGEPTRAGDPDFYGGKGYALYALKTPVGELWTANGHLLEGAYPDAPRRRLAQLLQYFGGMPAFGKAVVALGAFPGEGEDLRAVSAFAGFRPAGPGASVFVQDGEGMRLDAAASESLPSGVAAAEVRVAYARARPYAPPDAPAIDAAQLDKGVASGQKRLEYSLGAGIALLLLGTLLEAYCRGAVLRAASFACLAGALALFWYGMYHVDGQIAGYNAAIRYVTSVQR